MDQLKWVSVNFPDICVVINFAVMYSEIVSCVTETLFQSKILMQVY